MTGDADTMGMSGDEVEHLTEIERNRDFTRPDFPEGLAWERLCNAAITGKKEPFA